MFIVPRSFPLEFRRDVVAVARKGEAPLSQIARDFGVSESCLHRWLRLAGVDDGVRPGCHQQRVRRAAGAAQAEQDPGAGERDPAPGGGLLRLNGRSSQNEIPAGPRPCPDGVPMAVTCRVLGFSRQAFYVWSGNPVSQRDWDEAHLINAAIDIHRDDPAFGCRFIADELRAAVVRAGGQPGGPAVLATAALVGLQQEARPQQESRAARARRLGPPPVRRSRTGPAVADRYNRARHGRGESCTCARSETCGLTGSPATRWTAG